MGSEMCIRDRNMFYFRNYLKSELHIYFEKKFHYYLYLVLNQGIDRNEGRLRWTESELAFKIGLSLRF